MRSPLSLLAWISLGIHLILGSVACLRPAAAQALPGEFYTQTYQAMEQGDTRCLFEQLKTVYGQLGIRFPDALALRLQPFDQPLSGYNHDDLIITLSRMLSSPEEGPSYWNQWSLLLSNGLWKPADHYPSEESMALAGNFAILGILAHEMGHAVDYRYALSPRLTQAHKTEPNQAIKELVADQLAIYALTELAQDSRFQLLLKQYAQTTLKSLQESGSPGKLQTIEPAADLVSYSLTHEVPKGNVGLYVSYQLARQQELLEQLNVKNFADNLRATVATEEAKFQSAIQYLTEQAMVSSYPGIQILPERDPGLFGTDVYLSSGCAARWRMSPFSTTELLLESRHEPAATTRLNIAPLVTLSEQKLGIQYPKVPSRYQNYTSYLWDLVPIETDHYQALVLNRHRLTRRPSGASNTTLLVLDYSTGSAPQVTFYLSMARNEQMSAALKQSAQGEVRLLVYRQENPNQAGLLNVYGCVRGSWGQVSSQPAGFPDGGELRDGSLATQSYQPHWLLRRSLMTGDGELVVPTSSTIMPATPN